MPDDARTTPDPASGLTESDVGHLRAILGFPDAVATTDDRGRRGTRQEPAAEPLERGDTTPAATTPRAEDDLQRRLDHLSVRVEAVAGLVETLFDRVTSGAAGHTATLTSEELTDIAGRIVRIIEARLEAQSEHFDNAVAALGTRQSVGGVSNPGGGPDVRLLDDRMEMIGRAILDIKKAITLLESPSDMQEMAILSHLDRWFAEKNAEQTSEAEAVRNDLRRFDQTLTELSARADELPDHQALRDLYQTLSQQFYQAQLSLRDGMVEMQEGVKGLPESVALQQPIARLDSTILQQLDAKLAETSEGLAQKVEDQLAVRVQRFEALSQAMMTLVGDPVDSLNAKLGQLVRAQDAAPNVLQSIGELTQIQAQLAAAITSLRQDGIQREVLLREALDKLDRLTGDNPPAAPRGDPPPALFS